jgi:hypothetical protein
MVMTAPARLSPSSLEPQVGARQPIPMRICWMLGHGPIGFAPTTRPEPLGVAERLRFRACKPGATGVNSVLL